MRGFSRRRGTPGRSARFATGPCAAAPLFIDLSAGLFRVQYHDLIETLGMFGYEATLRKSMELFKSERDGEAAIDPSIRPGVMANVGRRADAGIFAELVKRMTTAVRVEDGWLYASALARVEDAALARQFLALTLGDAVPIQMVSWVPGMVAGNYTHRAMAYIPLV